MAYQFQVWISHSRISDFLRCPRAFYLKNIYKNPKTGNKMQIANPALSLGAAVHEVIESLAVLKTEDRFKVPLIKKFNESWEKVSGKRGGFLDTTTENQYKKRGEDLLEKLTKNPGPIAKPAVKINTGNKDFDLPSFPLTPEKDIILCGKIDWLEYVPEKNGVNIIDFKTSIEGKENPDSLQLPIYYLIAKNCQKYEVLSASYWYIEQSDTPTKKELPDYDESMKKVLNIAQKIKLQTQLDSFTCPNGKDGCRECIPFERILKGEGELVKTDYQNKKDVYILENVVLGNNKGEII
ncbi:PD-(D/E)XK nuclease family protein [Candidatus Dojkabacteria bacterium]|jgi:ATP-dependent helicase/DNAse subunit B|nr:PD-(D/E)XK nuclease family protein [Candidatus Dojkabacteria bacterium]